MARRLRIAVLIESQSKSLRSVLRGIAAYGRDHGPWSLYHQEGPLDPAVVRQLRDWRGDAVMFLSENRELVQEIYGLGLPSLDLVEAFGGDEVVQMARHDRLIAHQAAEHLLQRGFEHFAYCGFQGVWWSERRGDAFVAYLGEKGLPASVFTELRAESRISGYRLSPLGAGRQQEDTLAQWLTGLPRPVGLMACSDSCGQKVLRTCGELGIVVPEQMAVVGVDNDDLICELCDPPLSSVDPDFQQFGYAAAAAMVRVIQGERHAKVGQAVDPVGVVLRESTDVQAVADREVAAALHFIRQHACEGIGVDDVLRAANLSRSTLERRFTRLVGRSPRAEITRRQLERAQNLLAQTEFPLKKIARIAGFSYAESMCHLFKRLTGESPIAYRRRNRIEGECGSEG
jgi:LacI family transcriptional regulator